VNPSLIVVSPKIHEFLFKFSSIPEEDMVKVFTANGSDESLDERGYYQSHTSYHLATFNLGSTG